METRAFFITMMRTTLLILTCWNVSLEVLHRVERFVDFRESAKRFFFFKFLSPICLVAWRGAIEHTIPGKVGPFLLCLEELQVKNHTRYKAILRQFQRNLCKISYCSVGESQNFISNQKCRLSI